MEWSQHTGGIHPQLTKTRIATSFGKQRFHLSILTDSGSSSSSSSSSSSGGGGGGGGGHMRLRVEGANPLPVLDRVVGLCKKVLHAYMPHLRMRTWLPLPSSYGSMSVELTSLRSMVLKKRPPQIWIGESSLDADGAKQLFGSWLPDAGALRDYDLFFSYRQRTEAQLTECMFDLCTYGHSVPDGANAQQQQQQQQQQGGARPPRVFLDK